MKKIILIGAAVVCATAVWLAILLGTEPQIDQSSDTTAALSGCTDAPCAVILF